MAKKYIDADAFYKDICDSIEQMTYVGISVTGEYLWGKLNDALENAPAADVVEVPESGIGDLSDGYHTFNGLYFQRMVLFAALVKAYSDRSWKSYRHEDGELCFGGDWFIVGIDTPEGSYTYHYENKYWDMFDCIDLPRAKHWDGHTEADAETRLMSLEPKRTPERTETHSCDNQYCIQNGGDICDRVHCPIGQKQTFFDALTDEQEQLDFVQKHKRIPVTLVVQTHGDVISRQAAIVQLSHNKTGDDDCDVVIQNDIETIKALPSAEPEIVRCKDCKHHHYESKDLPYCDRIDYGYGWEDDDFCSRAERKES